MFLNIKKIQRKNTIHHALIIPFLTNLPILYPLKTPENQRFSVVFRGYEMRALARNGFTTAKFQSHFQVELKSMDMSHRFFNY